MVLAEHARSLMFHDYANAGTTTVACKAFYFLTGFGYEAVMLFFAISGYLVGGKVLSRMLGNKFVWRQYLCDRVSRLYAVLFVALAAGFLFDSLGVHFFNASGLYTASTADKIAVVGSDFSAHLGVGTFFGNLFFLQTILVPPLGSNGPLWSLANEWWYYVLFPLLLGIFMWRRFLRFFCFVASGFLLWFLPWKITALFGVWICGAITGLPAKPLVSPWLAFPACLVALTLLRLEFIGIPYLAEYALGITYCLALNSLSGYSCKWPAQTASQKLADFSYSVYLLHFPFVTLLLSILFSCMGIGLRGNFTTLNLVLYSIVVIVTISFSYLVSLATEAKTPLLRSLLYRLAAVQTQRKSAIPHNG